jgi:hypothetical protein
MTDSRKNLLAIALCAVVTIMLIAPAIQALPAAGGRFKLPFDVQWGGKMALPTGDYTFVVDHLSPNSMISVYRGQQAVGMVLPQTFESNEKESKKPELVCIRHDGKVTVRALRLPDIGTFYFSLPKELKVLVAQQPQLIETVSVEVSGN